MKLIVKIVKNMLCNGFKRNVNTMNWNRRESKIFFKYVVFFTVITLSLYIYISSSKPLQWCVLIFQNKYYTHIYVYVHTYIIYIYIYVCMYVYLQITPSLPTSLWLFQEITYWEPLRLQISSLFLTLHCKTIPYN